MIIRKFLLLFILGFVSVYCVDYRIPFYKLNLKGDVKSVTYLKDTQIKAPIPNMTNVFSIFNCNSSGNITSSYGISQKDTTSITDYRYDSDNKLIKKIHYDIGKEISFITNFSYNDEDKLVLQRSTNNVSKTERILKFYYNDIGEIAEIREFQADSILYKVMYYFYDSELVDVDSLESFILEVNSDLYSKYNLNSMIPYDNYQRFRKEFNFFNLDGNLVLKIDFILSDFLTVFTFEYDNGNLIKKETKNSNDVRYITKYYYDINGILIGRSERNDEKGFHFRNNINYKYDEMGNWVEQINNRKDSIEKTIRIIEYY